MPFIDNNTSSLLFKTKRNHVIKSTLICSAALAGIMAANPLATTTVKADAAPQIETSTTNWVATKPADIHVDNNQKTYTLNRGDTLWAIAQATNTDVNQLAQLNNINLEAGDQYHLAIGLTIKLTADAQTDDNSNNNATDNTNTATQNSAVSDSGNNTQSTTANNNSNGETPATTNSNNTTQTTNQAENSPQNTSNATADNQTENPSSNADNTSNAASSSANSSTTPASSSDSTTTSSQAENGSSNADNASNTNANTNKNGQVDPSKSQTSKPADVIHNESGAKTSGETNSQPAISQSGILNDGSISSKAPSSSTNNTTNNNNSDTASSKANTSSSVTASSDSSKPSATSSSAGNKPNDNTSNTASSKDNNSSSASTSSGSKANSISTSNAGPEPVNISSGANSSSSNANPNSGNGQSNAGSNSNSSSSSSSSSSSNNSNYKQTAPLNDNDLAKVVALEKQLNDLQIQANTVSNNLQFYQSFINATKNANGTNPQDRLDEIAYQNTYYQKTVDGYSNMSDEQAQLTAIKAQLPVDDQTITNLQNQLAKPDITDAEKQTLTTDLNNAKATAIKDQETYQTLQAKINQASELVSQYKDFLARNADMTAALKGNGQNNSLVTQYQKYINDNQNTQNSLNAQIADVKNQLKAYGVTVNS